MTLFSTSPPLSFSRDPTLLAGAFDSLSPSRPMLPPDLYLLAAMFLFTFSHVPLERKTRHGCYLEAL